MLLVKHMFYQCIAFSLIINCGSFRIEKKSENAKLDTAKSEKDVDTPKRPDDLFPNWVPFKNKHGDELGEFIQVAKVKPKKRLAPPINFILRSVAEQNQKNDEEVSNTALEVDFIEIKDPVKNRSQSSTNENTANEDDIDPMGPVKNKSTEGDHSSSIDKKVDTILSHEEISEINGLVGILKKVDPEHKKIAEFLHKSSELLSDHTETELTAPSDKLSIESTETVTERNSPQKPESDQHEKDENSSSEREQDDNSSNEKVEEAKPKEKTEEEKENEAKKAKILDEVDQLKARHEKEQKHIFRAEEDADESVDEDDSNNYSRKAFNRYREPESSDTSDDDYEGDEDVEEEERTTTTTSTTSTTVRPIRRRPIRRRRPYGILPTTRLNNHLRDTQRNKLRDSIPATTLRKPKYSARYLAANDADNVRISLIPTETPSSEAETKNASVFDTSAADSITSPDLTAPSSSGSTATGLSSDTSAVSAPFPLSDDLKEDVASSKIVAVSDTVPSGSEHKKQEEGDKEYSKGGGKEFHSEQSEEHVEKGKKAYEGVHKDTKGAKGHHDKEKHQGNYDDHGGHDKHHHHESGHYGTHHHEEEGKKHAKYEESGKHSKGHSTKGSHDVHKKEEYEKKVEFFEEDGDSHEEEKHGGYNHEKEHSSGGKYNKGNLNADHHAHHKGEKGHFEKGGHGSGYKGHKVSGGHDSHGNHGHSLYEKGGKDFGKKWIYHHGHPPLTANLVVIDRRADRLQHGPLYFG